MPSRSTSSPKDPDDWSSITESAQRRKVQNRISQRNHRQRVRARIAQLEAAVASSGLVVPNAEQPSRASKASCTSPQLCNVFPISGASSNQASEYSPSPLMSKACSPQLASNSVSDLQCEVKLEPASTFPPLRSTGMQRQPSSQYQQKSFSIPANSKNIQVMNMGWNRPESADDLAMRFPKLHAMFSPQTSPELTSDDYLIDNESNTPLNMSSEITGGYAVADLESWAGANAWHVQQPEPLTLCSEYGSHDVNQWRQHSAFSVAEHGDMSSKVHSPFEDGPSYTHQHMVLPSTTATEGYCSHCVCQRQTFDPSRSSTPSSASVKPDDFDYGTNQMSTGFYHSAMMPC